MASTIFTDGVTLTDDEWFNHVNDAVYEVLGDGTTPPSTAVAAMKNLFKKGADIASAATVNLAAATGNYIHVTGTVTITSFGTVNAGVPFMIVFDGVLTITHNATSLILPNGLNITTAAGDSVVIVSEGSGNWRLLSYNGITTTENYNINGGRLSLTTGVAITTSDVTAAETIYFTPYISDLIGLYTSGSWRIYRFTERTLDVPDVTQMHDVFLYDNAGTLTLEALAWTNDTTRATALVSQNGVLVKSGETNKRYLGSFYSTTAGNGQTEDSFANRYLWNYYNQVEREMRNALETTNSWTYTTDAWRQANANAANQLNFIVGVNERPISATVLSKAFYTVGPGISVGIGLDSTTVDSSNLRVPGTMPANEAGEMIAQYAGYAGIGKHFLAWLERTTAAGVATWYGDDGNTVFTQGGIFGRTYG